MNTETLNSSSFVLDSRTTANLRQALKDDPRAGLRQAAQQFEGMLLQMMLKSMREAMPQDGLLDSDQTRFFTTILDQQLAQNLSSRNALGFAKAMEQSLGRGLPSEGNDTLNDALGRLRQSVSEQQTASSAAFFAGDAGGRTGRVAAASASAVSAASPRAPDNARDYVDRVWPHAVDAARSLGVPPHFLVAHSALESGWGKSEIRLPNGASSYNIFGIKAGKSWQGPTVEVPTTEYVDGVAQRTHARFRVYASYSEAFQDYAKLLRGNSRYSAVLGQQDGAQFARSLQQSGYATDPGYADKLGRIIGGATLRQALAA